MIQSSGMKTREDGQVKAKRQNSFLFELREDGIWMKSIRDRGQMSSDEDYLVFGNDQLTVQFSSGLVSVGGHGSFGGRIDISGEVESQWCEVVELHF